MVSAFRFELCDLPPAAEALRQEVRAFLAVELAGHPAARRADVDYRVGAVMTFSDHVTGSFDFCPVFCRTESEGKELIAQYRVLRANRGVEGRQARDFEVL